MKLNLEIELDWIEEDMSIDETVKGQIINSIVSKIETQISKKIEDEVSSLIDKTIVSKINEKTDSLFTDFTSRQVTITDSYGDKIMVYESIEKLMKERFDKFLTEKVDDKGNSSTSNYGKNYTRLEFVVTKQLSDFANKFTTDAVKQVSEEIKQHVKEGLTTKLGAELMSVLKVNDMLQISTKK